jgi:hypothetical protein
MLLRLKIAVYNIKAYSSKVLKISLDYNLYILIIIISLNHSLIPLLVISIEYPLVPFTFSPSYKILVTLNIYSLLFFY